MLKVAALLWRGSWIIGAIAALTSVVSAACSVGVIAFVNAILSSPGARPGYWLWCFVGLCLAYLVTRALSQYLLTSIAQNSVARLRQHLCQKILAAPLCYLEEQGPSRLLTILVDDTLAITDALHAVPFLVVNAAILLGCTLYLIWLSWTVLCGLGIFIFLGGIGTYILRRQAFGFVRLVRQEQNTLFALFRALTDGVKELKLNCDRRLAFLTEDIKGATESLKSYYTAAVLRFLAVDVWSQFLLYFMIGLALFALPAFSDGDASILPGFLLTILYAMRPIVAITNMLPIFSRARVALDNVEGLEQALAERWSETWLDAPDRVKNCWEQLSLSGVTYRYQCQEQGYEFRLGPIDFALRPKEIVFLVGGNGSGKSTLAKLIMGLYLPEAGQIRLNGALVTASNQDEYRQLFAVVFGEPYVFDKLYGYDASSAAVEHYLRQLGLESKLRITNGLLSTTALSQGQRRRLALLAAYIEDRPIYIFDEWAANQDPCFKDLFYRQMLPELVTRGKAALVITHDERYYHIADRLIRMEGGKFVTGEPGASRHCANNGRVGRSDRDAPR